MYEKTIEELTVINEKKNWFHSQVRKTQIVSLAALRIFFPTRSVGTSSLSSLSSNAEAPSN
jgi:hypothetical protein